MRLLLDTSVFLWAVSEPDRLTAAAAEALSDPSNERFVSPVSTFELAQKAGLGKRQLEIDVRTFVTRGMQDVQAQTLELTHEQSAGVEQLPLLHRDPFDRLLIAQALSEGLLIVTSDRWFAGYGVEVAW